MILHPERTVNNEKRLTAAFSVIAGMNLNESLKQRVRLFTREKIEAGVRLGGFTVKLSKLPRGKCITAVRVYWWDESGSGTINTSYNEFYERH
jgi:hypothetical protein